MILKNGSKIGTATVVSDKLLKAGAMIPNASITVKSVTAHNTGNWDVPANNYYRSLKRQNDTKPDNAVSSYHFVVDDKEIYQIVDTNRKTYHAGSKANASSIGVEICMFKDKARHERAKKNAQLLIVTLLKGHNLSSSSVYSHNYWTGKNCPETILPTWGTFTREIKDLYSGGSTSTPSTPSSNGFNVGDKVKVSTNATKYYTGQTIPSFVKGSTYTVTEVKSDKVLLSDVNSWFYPKDLIKVETSFKVKITADVLNVRSGAGTNYKVTTQVKKGDVYTIVETLNGWGKLKSGAGWISLDYTIKI